MTATDRTLTLFWIAAALALGIAINVAAVVKRAAGAEIGCSGLCPVVVTR